MFHSHCELIYVNEGIVKMTVDGMEKTVDNNNFALVFPYVTHSYQGGENANVTVVLFDPHETLYEKELMTKRAKTPFYCDNIGIARHLDRICALKTNSGEKFRKSAISYLNAAISEIMIVTELVTANNSEQDNSKRILEYCSEHFTEDLSIKRVCDELYLSESCVSKIFSEKLNFGFREYINLLRIDKAKKLLKTTNAKIVDIMLDSGFKNQSSFNRVFKDAVGESPFEYRKGGE